MCMYACVCVYELPFSVFRSLFHKIIEALYVCMYVCTYICIYIYMYIYTYNSYEYAQKRTHVLDPTQ
jgi:hypothetical protein